MAKDKKAVAKKKAAGKKKAAPKRKLAKEEFDVISCERVEFTNELAQEMTDMEEFPGERVLRDRHALYLAGEMENGTFLYHETNLAKAICMWDKKERRVNGHHTCVGRSLFDVMRINPFVQLTVYRVKSEEEFRRLYSKFDRIAPRTRSHIGNIRLFNTPEFEGIPQSVLAKLLQGHRIWLGKDCVIDDSCDLLLNKHNRLAHKVLPCIRTIVNTRQASFSRKAAVFGALFETFNKCSADADTFWSAVVTGLNFSSEFDPAKMLRDWLIQYTIKEQKVKLKDNAVVTVEMIYRACVLAFNKYRTGEPMKIMKVSQLKSRPKAK